MASRSYVIRLCRVEAVLKRGSDLKGLAETSRRQPWLYCRKDRQGRNRNAKALYAASNKGC